MGRCTEGSVILLAAETINENTIFGSSACRRLKTVWIGNIMINDPGRTETVGDRQFLAMMILSSVNLWTVSRLIDKTIQDISLIIDLLAELELFQDSQFHFLCLTLDKAEFRNNSRTVDALLIVAKFR